MAHIGIGYSGADPEFLRAFVEQQQAWLSGDRQPRFFGDRFLVLYDSNTAREFAAKCAAAAPEDTIALYAMDRPVEAPPSRPQ